MVTMPADDPVEMRGPDGAAHQYIPSAEAARRLGESRSGIHAAARAYWLRIERERSLGGPVVYDPGARELACLRLAQGTRGMWWIREDTLTRHFVNVPDKAGRLARGWPAGKRRGPEQYRRAAQNRKAAQTARGREHQP
jgi:hypothetical protein